MRHCRGRLGLLGQGARADLRTLPAYGAMASLLPGRSEDDHPSFLCQGENTWLDWAACFVSTLGLTGQKAVQALKITLGPWQGGVGQLVPFLDPFTDTYQHSSV